jgi:hypothetical protein
MALLPFIESRHPVDVIRYGPPAGTPFWVQSLAILRHELGVGKDFFLMGLDAGLFGALGFGLAVVLDLVEPRVYRIDKSRIARLRAGYGFFPVCSRRAVFQIPGLGQPADQVGCDQLFLLLVPAGIRAMVSSSADGVPLP